jgi:hypothetical protein
MAAHCRYVAEGGTSSRDHSRIAADEGAYFRRPIERRGAAKNTGPNGGCNHHARLTQVHLLAADIRETPVCDDGELPRDRGSS